MKHMFNLAYKKNAAPPRATDVIGPMRRKDPTMTTTLRAQWVAHVNRIVRGQNKKIFEKVVTEDFFEVRGDQSGIGRKVIPVDFQMAKKTFVYRHAYRKQDEFLVWLRQLHADGILSGIQSGDAFRGNDFPIRPPAWCDVYIQSAYQKGMAQIRKDLIASGIDLPDFDPPDGGIGGAMNQPFHAERVGLIYSRIYEDLKGVSAVTSSRISDALARGMAEGVGPYEMARRLQRVENNITGVRARLIARTETIRAHSEARLNEALRTEQELGEEIRWVWITAGDSDVRAKHSRWAEMSRNIPFRHHEVQQLIGEPNCRCSQVPWVESIHGPLEKPKKKRPPKKATTTPSKRTKGTGAKPKLNDPTDWPPFGYEKISDAKKAFKSKFGVKEIYWEKYKKAHKGLGPGDIISRTIPPGEYEIFLERLNSLGRAIAADCKRDKWRANLFKKRRVDIHQLYLGEHDLVPYYWKNKKLNGVKSAGGWLWSDKTNKMNKMSMATGGHQPRGQNTIMTLGGWSPVEHRPRGIDIFWHEYGHALDTGLSRSHFKFHVWDEATGTYKLPWGVNKKLEATIHKTQLGIGRFKKHLKTQRRKFGDDTLKAWVEQNVGKYAAKDDLETWAECVSAIMNPQYGKRPDENGVLKTIQVGPRKRQLTRTVGPNYRWRLPRELEKHLVDAFGIPKNIVKSWDAR